MDPADLLEQQQLTQSKSELGTFWHRCRSNLVAARLQREHVGDVVDVGAGAGHLGSWLALRAPEITYRFSEPNDRLADALAERFSAAQAFDPAAPGARTDALVMLDVIEHVPDDRAFLETWLPHLRPGGLLVVTVPALPRLYSAWDEAMGHHRRYTKRSLRALASALPVTVIECSYLFPELTPPALVRRVTKPPESETSPEFPVFAPPVDRALYGFGRATASLRRAVPVGTSLLLVGRARGDREPA